MKPSKVLLAAAAAAAPLAVSALSASPAAAGSSPAAATALTAGVIGPGGGTLSGFGITVTFDRGAVSGDRYLILGNWPNGLDVPPRSGQAVKTFGIQECGYDAATGGPQPGTCTSEFGNYLSSPAGSERLEGQTVDYTAHQALTWPTPDAQGNTNFGTGGHKLVQVTIRTGGDQVYVYNPNVSGTDAAYPVLLPSTPGPGTLSFSTFQPIVWTVTSPTG